jgi:hypothetical protein
MRIYIQQYGGFWGCDVRKWKEAVREVVYGSGQVDYDNYARPLRSQPGSIVKSEDGRYSCTAPENEFRLVQPLDWTDEDWAAEAALLGVTATDRSPSSGPKGAQNSRPVVSHDRPARQLAAQEGEATPSYMLPLTNSDETDEQVLVRLQRRFNALKRYSAELIRGDISSLIVSGGPGIGKSHELRKQLEESGRTPWLERRVDSEGAVQQATYGYYDIVSGTISAVGLFQALWNMKDGGILLLDDCDAVFRNEDSLNILKSALDTDPRHRRISWRKDSRWIEELGMERTFQFDGQIVFITNLDFEAMIAKGSKLAPHFEAFIDRSRYLSLAMRSQRDYMVHIRSVASGPNGMLANDFGLNEGDIESVLSFIDENKSKFFGLSLRLVGQVAEEYLADPDNWQENIELSKMRTA